MKNFILFIFIIFLSSCATLFNSNYAVTEIDSYPQSAKVIINNDTLCCTPRPVSFLRSGEEVEIQLIHDTLSKNVLLQPKPSPIFLWGNIFTYFVGYAVDFTNDKRFTYPSNVFVNLTTPDHVAEILRDKDNEPLNFIAGIVFVDQYFVSNKFFEDNPLGTGLHVGFEYYLDNNLYLSHQVGFSAGNSSEDIEGADGNFQTHFANIRVNRKYNKVHLGGGLSYQNLLLKYEKYLDVPKISIKESHKSLNLSFTAQYNFYENFFIGASFQPGFYSFSSKSLSYESNWTLECVYKLEIFDLKKNRK